MKKKKGSTKLATRSQTGNDVAVFDQSLHAMTVSVQMIEWHFTLYYSPVILLPFSKAEYV
jgi:hypothetical protein